MIYSFNSSDIFKDIPDDPDHILMNIPHKILEEMGWRQDDVLCVTVNDDKIVVTKNG